MLRRSIKFRCGHGNCKKSVECNTDSLGEAEDMARHLGWLIADGEWLSDLCPGHWVDEMQRRIKAGYEITYNKKGLPRLQPPKVAIVHDKPRKRR
jgi:hypothetical protein